MIAGVMSFNSGILLFADTQPLAARRIPYESTRILHREYGSGIGPAHSIFVSSGSAHWARGAFQRCEQALDAIAPAERTIDRMRQAVELTLRDTGEGSDRQTTPGLPWFVVLYSPCELRYSVLRAISTTLQDVGAYDCQGTNVFHCHRLIRDRYSAARSLDELDLTTVFTIVVDTLRTIRDAYNGCAESTEMVVIYANGHVSDVQRIAHDSPKQRVVTLARLGRGARTNSGPGGRAPFPDPSR
jgi:hypothetical protein